MRALFAIFILVLLTLPVAAQTPDAPVTPADAALRAEAAAQNAESAAQNAQDAAENAQAAADAGAQAVDYAFNLLGLFEALGIVITVVGGVAGLVGFSQLLSARRELTAARERIEQEIDQYKQQVATEISHREAELDALRDTLRQEADNERRLTSNALLANALLPIGERQYKTGDYEGALNTYNRALELDPQNPVVHQRIGYVYTHSGQLEQADYHYQCAIDREPDFAPALAGLGFVYRRMAEKLPDSSIERTQLMNRAEDYLLQGLKISPKLVDDDGESWWGVLGGLYKRRGQIDDAINAYRRAMEVTPQSSYGAGNLAMLYMRKNDRERMLETYKQVERIAEKEADQEQGNFWGYADLVVARYALGKVEAAEEALPIALQIAPADSPYMLDGLIDTLQDLMPVLDPAERPAIERAIERIRNHRLAQQEERKQQAEEESP